jgi:biotin-dependent carboxylase-like uncharacterized protein
VAEKLFEVIQPGVFSTVQDLGRKGYLASGIPPSGAMDRFALKMGNLLVKNRMEDAGIEVTAIGVTVRVLTDTVAAVTGGFFDVKKNGEPVPLWQAFEVRKNDILTMGRAEKGWRGYLCVSGGIDVPLVLGSKSTYTMGALGGYRGRTLKKGDIIMGGSPGDPLPDLIGRRIKPKVLPNPDDAKILRVVMGPQDDYVTDESIETFLSVPYNVSSKANRVGYRFIGPQFKFKKIQKAKDAGSDPSNIVDDGNSIGAIQIPGGVEPICLAVDGVSMGGYVKIACLIAADMDRMAQLRIGDAIRFQSVDVDTAREILIQLEEMASMENIEQTI